MRITRFLSCQLLVLGTAIGLASGISDGADGLSEGGQTRGFHPGMRVAATLAGWLAEDARAANITVDSPVPTIDFLDTTDTGQLVEFSIVVNSNTFRLFDAVDDIDVFKYTSSDGDDAGLNSIVIEPTGAMSFANGIFHIDKNGQSIGIKTVTPSADFDIHDTTPDMRLFDIDDLTEIEFNLSGDQMIFWGRPNGGGFRQVMRYNVAAPSSSLHIGPDGEVGLGTASPRGDLEVQGGQVYLSPATGNTWALNPGNIGLWFRDFTSGTTPLKITNGAPGDSLVIGAAGDVAVGTAAPLAPLHVLRSDGTAGVLVEEASAVVRPRTLFTLANPGNTKFEIMNTDAANSWAFTNSGNDFRISLQDSGRVEFRIDNNGNAYLAGDLDIGGTFVTNLAMPSDRDSKQDVEAIDASRILDQLAEMPVSTWEYSDRPGERHIGPMAQDFHAAFGLGDDDATISVVDASGVALASIQALASRNSALSAELESLKAENGAMKRRLALVESLLRDLHPRVVQN